MSFAGANRFVATNNTFNEVSQMFTKANRQAS